MTKNISLSEETIKYLTSLAKSKKMTFSGLLTYLAKELEENGIVDVENIPVRKNSRVTQ